MRNRRDRVWPIVNRELADRDSYQGGARDDLLRLWREYLHPYRAYVFAGVATMAVLAIVQLCGFPLTHRYLLDVALNENEPIPEDKTPFLRALWIVVFLNCGLWLTRLVSEWAGRRLVLAAGQGLAVRLRKDLHQKLQNLHIGFYERTPSGRIMSRVLDDVEVIYKWSTQQLVEMTREIGLFVVGVSMMFYLSWRLALPVVVAIPFYIYAVAKMRPLVRKVHIAIRSLNSKMYALANERVRGIRVVKAFTREKRELRRMAKLMFEQVRLRLRFVRYQQGLGLMAATISGVAMFLALWWGFELARKGPAAGGISLGTAIAFAEIIRQFFMPVQALTNRLTAIQAVIVVVQRVLRLLDEPEDVVPGRIALAGMTGKIRFDQVTFRYPGQVDPAVDDLSLKIEPGQKVALMGPSGSGKTTVFSLLLRFYDPQEGKVRVGGVDLTEADPGSVRRHVCMVQQEPIVFSGTLADNIIYGRLDATPKMVMEAAQRAELHEFVMTLPIKYETEVGENGITLSGGQKQRLALATALLTDPEILLLDDTTSALDAATEARIRGTLNQVLEGRTSLIITQRIATARDCDRIIVLENGRISQDGTHEELRGAAGFYHRICRQQEAL